MRAHRHANGAYTVEGVFSDWSASQATDLHWWLYLYSLHLSWTQAFSSAAGPLLPALAFFLSTLSPSYRWSILPFPSLSLFHSSSLPSVLSLLLGIGSSISFKAHVKGTVCQFQRLLYPPFLPLNLVSPKHFPIAWLSRPLFSCPPSLPSRITPGSLLVSGAKLEPPEFKFAPLKPFLVIKCYFHLNVV